MNTDLRNAMKEIECRLIKRQLHAWQLIRAALAESTNSSPNTGSPKLPTLEEVESHVHDVTMRGSYCGHPSKIELAYDFICRQLRAGA